MNDHDDRADLGRPDEEPTRADAEFADRYATIGDCTGRTLLLDVGNDDAWVRSDTVLAVEDWR